MAYQNINQYVYNKWYLAPVREISDLSLASDERDYNEEVIFSPYVIGVNDGDVMPIKIDLNFSGSNQGFILDYQNIITKTTKDIRSFIFWMVIFHLIWLLVLSDIFNSERKCRI